MPASYPTAVKSFTTKNAGDVIQPGHINDLQDEVAAIESGLLNGTAPLNSSNSTFAALSVTGLSTFAGNVQMSSNCTIAGTLTVNKIISTSLTAAGVTSYVRAYSQNPVQIAAAYAAMTLETEIADLLGEYDSTTFTFTPQVAGYYLIKANGYTAGNNSYLGMGIFVNSTLVDETLQSGGAGVTITGLTLSNVLSLSSGAAGAVQVKIFHNGSTTRGDSGVGRNQLEIVRLF